ncbi:methyltransferase [Streptomyces sp. HNM0575]|uniref:O-methyltransferase n=1 Tax=Streptomyces sp. HNM0575 TaxID=2716338 RepID=UPI00145F75AF|nr:class I SAM-dependent methyltransferase [Streptomyces sp. HNM0575]NLU74992.1 methyltransferase [Streptomyces sp. HNM0575]
MDSLTAAPVSDVLTRLFDEASVADRKLYEEFADGSAFGGESVSRLLEQEAKDYKNVYRNYAGNFLNVSAEFGRFLYVCARARQAKRIVEFGTSFGVSTIHLATALNDGGGGRLVTTELEASKARRAQENLEAAGLADLVDIRVGDALETLRDGVGGEVDLVLLDGAFSLYLPVLRLLEPHLRPGALVIAENAIEPSTDYLGHVRDPDNGYRTVSLPFEEGRGNEMSVFTR